jgi:hypothetical protein
MDGSLIYLLIFNIKFDRLKSFIIPRCRLKSNSICMRDFMLIDLCKLTDNYQTERSIQGAGGRDFPNSINRSQLL